MGWLLLAFLIAPLGLSACSGSGKRGDSRMHAVLGISMPCSLSYVGMSEDGGTLSGLLVGTDGESLRFAHDWRVRSMPTPPEHLKRGSPSFHAWAESVARAEPRLATVGTYNPEEPGAKPLAVGSEAESLFIVAVHSALLDESLPESSSSRASGMLAFLEHQRNPTGLPSANPDSLNLHAK